MTAPPDPVTWLILVYRLPAHSGLKAVIGRKATALGAVYPTNAVAALPASRAAERAFWRLRNMIGEAASAFTVMATAMLIEASGGKAPARQLASRWTRKITAGSVQTVNARNASAA